MKEISFYEASNLLVVVICLLMLVSKVYSNNTLFINVLISSICTNVLTSNVSFTKDVRANETIRALELKPRIESCGFRFSFKNLEAIQQSNN